MMMNRVMNLNQIMCYLMNEIGGRLVLIVGWLQRCHV